MEGVGNVRNKSTPRLKPSFLSEIIVVLVLHNTNKTPLRALAFLSLGQCSRRSQITSLIDTFVLIVPREKPTGKNCARNKITLPAFPRNQLLRVLNGRRNKRRSLRNFLDCLRAPNKVKILYCQGVTRMTLRVYNNTFYV